MRRIIDIPDYNLDDVQNGSIACGQILKAVKNGKPYEEQKSGEWIMNKDENPECPFCHHSFIHWSNFCPECGADMR